VAAAGWWRSFVLSVLRGPQRIVCNFLLCSLSFLPLANYCPFLLWRRREILIIIRLRGFAQKSPGTMMCKLLYPVHFPPSSGRFKMSSDSSRISPMSATMPWEDGTEAASLCYLIFKPPHTLPNVLIRDLNQMSPPPLLLHTTINRFDEHNTVDTTHNLWNALPRHIPSNGTR
jgi:hypothetical protein